MSVPFSPKLEHTLEVGTDLFGPGFIDCSILVEIGFYSIAHHHQVEKQCLIRITTYPFYLLAGLVENIAVELVAGLGCEDLAEEHQLELIQMVELAYFHE